MMLLGSVAAAAQTIPADYFGRHTQCSATLNPATGTNYNVDCGTNTVAWPSIPTAPNPSNPFGLLRMWDDKVKFSQIATASSGTPQTSWYWTTFDYWVQQARTNGVELLYDGEASTPTWACSGTCASPSTSSVPTDAAWSQFVTAILSRSLDTVTNAYCTSGATCRPVACQSTGTWAGQLTGCISTFEVWNEPNATGSYAGTMAQMVHLAALAKAARNAIAGI
jgi:hypothetical protein